MREAGYDIQLVPENTVFKVSISHRKIKRIMNCPVKNYLDTESNLFDLQFAQRYVKNFSKNSPLLSS